jgi:hypothetical protein
MSLITQAAIFAAGAPAGGDTPINDAALSRLILVVVGLMIMVIGALALWAGKKGDIKKPLNILGVVLVAAVIVTIGSAFMFPDLGAKIIDTVFSS